MTCDGEVYEHPQWAPHIDESDGSASDGKSEMLAWPTPAAKPFDQSPEAFDKRRARMKKKGYNGNGAGRLLAVEVRRSWATPTARDWKSGKTSQRTANRNSRPLSEQVETKKEWPTMLASDHMTAGPNQNTATLGRCVRRIEGNARLNPCFVEVLMGYPVCWTSPSTDGPHHQARSTIGSHPEPEPEPSTTKLD
tara:strand:- start:172 stop:753 length:582 start_codon:yes stop_codon:yes gene_type:complete